MASEKRREDEVLLALLAGLDESRCGQGIQVQELERLARGSLGAEEARRRRQHMAECLPCLHAYAQTQATLELSAASDDQAGVARDASGRSLRLAERVREFLAAVEGLLAGLRQRAVQARYSDPSLQPDSLSFAMSPPAASYLVAERLSGDTSSHAEADLLEQTQLLERAVEERLRTARAIKALARKERSLERDIQRMSREPDRSGLLRELKGAREHLIALMTSASSNVRV